MLKFVIFSIFFHTIKHSGNGPLAEKLLGMADGFKIVNGLYYPTVPMQAGDWQVYAMHCTQLNHKLGPMFRHGICTTVTPISENIIFANYFNL